MSLRHFLSFALGIIAAAGTASAADGDPLRTTRWNIASYLYLLNYGKYDPAASEANVDYAARLGFNAVRFNVWWHEIYPDAAAVKTGGQWAGLDHNVQYAIRKGLKVVLTVSLRVRPDTLFAAEDCVLDADGQRDSNWDKTTRISFSSPRFGRAIRFFQQVGERYRDPQNAGHILMLAPLVSREAEIAYAHDKMEDYNPAFIREFRAWLMARYAQKIGTLNEAWGTQYKAFDEINPPRDFAKTAGRDWYIFRDLKARQFVDSCAAAMEAIPGLKTPYRLLLDYGNVGDPMAWRRGSISFAFHAAPPMVWAVKHNDAHDYDQAYTGSLLGGVMRQMNKLAFNEYFYDRNQARYPGHNVIEDSFREIKGHYDQGMNGVSFVGVHPPNPDLDAIIAKLKASGVWSAPVSARATSGVPVERVKFSTLLGLQGWEVKQRFFDPHFKAGQRQVDFQIEHDLNETLLPIIKPQD